jgi:cell division septation protein DedD
MPDGYAPVWQDDRLNPNRARGTAAGEAQMRQVWTAETPMRLVDEPRRGVFGTQRPQQVLTPAASAAIRQPYGSGGDGVPAASSGGHYVQVGSFGVAANAASTAQRLQSRGLPVAQQAARAGGRSLQVVLAGPFPTEAAAHQALAAARGLGFHDAFVR